MGQDLVLDREWIAVFDYAGWPDTSGDIGLDSHGDVYVVGEVRDEGYRAYALVKYSGNGVLLWDREEEVGFVSTPVAPRLVVDSDDSVLVAGNILGAGDDEDWFTVRYSSAGERLASRSISWDESSEGVDDIAVDSLGFVYLSGSFQTSDSTSTTVMGKYTAGLADVWSATFALADDYGFGVAVGPDGSVYHSVSSTGFGSQDDIVTIKYSSLGALQWTERYNGGCSWADDWPARLLVDASGNIYIVGYSVDSSECRHGIVTIKYSPAGAVLWTRRYDHDPGSCDPGAEDYWAEYAAGLAVDASGRVYVAGRSWGGASGFDLVILAYGPDGEPRWERRFDGPAGFHDVVADLSLDANGRVWITGSTSGCPDCWYEYDYLAVVYSPQGKLLAADIFASKSSLGVELDNEAQALVIDRTGGAVYVTGTSSSGNSFNTDLTTIRYRFPTAPIFSDGFESASTSAWSLTWR